MEFPDIFDEEDYDEEDLYNEYDGHDVHVEAHEMFLFEYHPQLLDEEEPDLFKVLKLAEMTSKLVDAVHLRIGRVRHEGLQWFR